MFTIPIVVALLICILAIILLLQPENLSRTSIDERMMRNEFKSSKHKWEKSHLKSFYFCYLCNKLTNGFFSDVLECKKCGIIIHRICRFLKLRKPDCKFVVAKTNSSKFYHQWRQCRHSSNANCTVCGQICTGLESYLCLWCNRSRHTHCSGDSLECNFGPLRKMILEPTEIKCTGVNFTTDAFKSLRRINKLVKDKTEESEDDGKDDSSITISCHPSKTVAIVLINKKSGGQVGNEFIKAFYRALNPLQVISILDEGLDKLKLFSQLPRVFLVIAGGDGTVCSVMNYVKTIPKWKDNNPPFAILPLGTGNDLSRSLGWGGSVEDVDAGQLLLEIDTRGQVEQIDRWKMVATTGEQSREFTVYNYIGMGLQGKICKDFHEIRQKYPQLFFSQFSNKLIYTQIGSSDIFKNTRTPLSQLLSLSIDGRQVSIDEYENIIFLNIHHWGGGVQLWSHPSGKDYKTPSFSDGLIEVIGLTDIIHMGQVQVGMDEAFPIGQGKVIEILSKAGNKVIPLQIDGEPVQMMSPLRILIERKDQISALTTKCSENCKIAKILQTALNQKIINEKQMDQLTLLSRNISA